MFYLNLRRGNKVIYNISQQIKGCVVVELSLSGMECEVTFRAISPVNPNRLSLFRWERPSQTQGRRGRDGRIDAGMHSIA